MYYNLSPSWYCRIHVYMYFPNPRLSYRFIFILVSGNSLDTYFNIIFFNFILFH